MTLIARTKAVMDEVLADIQRTPGEALLEGGGEAVWLGNYVQSADGRCAISHPFTEPVEDWLEAYCLGYPAPGDITFLPSGLPTDWQHARP